MPEERLLKERRCEQCGKLLFKYMSEPNNNCLIEVKCDRCQTISRVKLLGQGAETASSNWGMLLLALFALANLFG